MRKLRIISLPIALLACIALSTTVALAQRSAEKTIDRPLTDQVRIEVNDELNTIILSGDRQDVARVKKIINRLLVAQQSAATARARDGRLGSAAVKKTKTRPQAQAKSRPKQLPRAKSKAGAKQLPRAKSKAGAKQLPKAKSKPLPKAQANRQAAQRSIGQRLQNLERRLASMERKLDRLLRQSNGRRRAPGEQANAPRERNPDRPNGNRSRDPDRSKR